MSVRQTSYNADQRLLKLHGCTRHPEDIVLTHEDYVEFMHSRPALQGMVQSLLMTKHVLFVGFGLQDDNLFQIFSSVKKSLNGRKGEDKLRTCTSLLVGASRLVREMWQDDVKIFEFAPAGGATIGAGGRKQEIFLEYVSTKVALSAASSFSLVDRFDGMKDQGEKELHVRSAFCVIVKMTH